MDMSDAWDMAGPFYNEVDARPVEALFKILGLLDISKAMLICWQSGESSRQIVVGVQYSEEGYLCKHITL